MNTQNALEDIKVNVKLKLAALWTSLMFLIIYLDYFALYMPGVIKNILKERVFVFDITQGFLLAALTVVTIPALMIFLSVTKTDRTPATNSINNKHKTKKHEKF